MDDVAAEGPSPRGGTGPLHWLVTWGVLARSGFVVEHVDAFDADEALTIAAQRHPELERPRVALLVTSPEVPADGA
jgi:hypothetical protein